MSLQTAPTGSMAQRGLRILHIGKYFPPHPGGMETFLRDLMQAQERAGDAPQALVHRSERSVRNGIPHVTHAAVWFTALFTPIAPGFGLLAQRLIRRSRPQILHIHMPNVSAFWLLFLPAARRIPWVVHWQSDVLASSHRLGLRLFYTLYRPFERALLRRAALIICSSPPYLASSVPLQSFVHKCRVVPLGLDMQRLNAHYLATQAPHTDAASAAMAEPQAAYADPGNGAGTRQTYHSATAKDTDSSPVYCPTDTASTRVLPCTYPTESEGNSTELRVLCLGRHTYYKGIEYLLRALPLLPPELQVRLQLVGNGERSVSLRAEAAALGISAQVEFLGALDDAALAAELMVCDCLVLPSIERTEAFGIVLLEAMQFGKPVIATAVEGSGMSWVVQDGVTGRVVPPADAAALAEALADFAGSRAKMRTMGEAGRQRLLQHFAIDRVAAALAALYAELLDGLNPTHDHS